MQSLLNWSLANSQPVDPNAERPVQPREDLDPGIIDLILGKPDSQLMKEALAVATDDKQSENDRLTALDDFEMLIEQIDNANNITAMKMWEPLQGLLTSSSSTEEIKSNTLWVIGTAVQNNPAAQDAYLSTADAPLATILNMLSSAPSPGARSKAIYALSGLLKHNARAVGDMEELKGWEIMKSSLEDSNIAVRRKTVFLLNTLLLPNVEDQPTGSNLTAPVHPNSHASMTVESTATFKVTAEALQKHGIIDLLVAALINPLQHGEDGESEGDVDFTEKAVRLLFTYLTCCAGQLSSSDKEQLKTWFRSHQDKGEHWDLGQEELALLLNKLT